MWTETKKIMDLTLEQFRNNPVKYLNEMKLKKVLINKNDYRAYSDNSYVKNSFA